MLFRSIITIKVTEKKRMESILKSIEKVKSENRQKTKKDDEDMKEKEIKEDEKEVKSLNLGEKLRVLVLMQQDGLCFQTVLLREI